MLAALRLLERAPRVVILVISLLLIITHPPPPPVFAATITVDEGCDFLEAVISARDNAAPSGSECEAGDKSGHGAADVIVLTEDIAVSNSVVLELPFDGLNTPPHSLTIEGNGYRISNGSGTNPIFRAGRDVKMILNNIIISGRNATNGGVFDGFRGDFLTIRGSVFENNRSTGVNPGAGVIRFAGGSIDKVVIEDSVFSNNTGRVGGAMTGTPPLLEIRRSIFENNSSLTDGGAFYIIGTTTVDDSSFIGNSSPAGGGAIVGGSDLTVRNSTFSRNRGNTSIVTLRSGDSQHRAIYQHVTFTDNTVSDNSSSGIVSRYYDPLNSGTGRSDYLDLFNSVVAGNSGPDIFCSRAPGSPPTQNDLNVTNTATSYIEDGSCGSSKNLENNGPALLGERQTSDTEQTYFVPQPRGTVIEIDDVTGEEIEVTITSPLVDMGATARCLSKDQLGRSRSVGASCDIGAIEYIPPPPQQQPVVASASRSVYKPPIPVGSTCYTRVPASISVSPVYDGMQCQMLNDAGIGNQALVEAGYILALDIWGWVGGAGTEVCFSQPGRLLLVDTAPLQRTHIDVASYHVNGKTCGHIDRRGQVLLLPIPAPAARELRACWATTLALLNLRSTPALGDNVIGSVKAGTVLRTDLQVGDWYRVELEGLTGWISAEYTRTAGVCMPAGGSLVQDSLETLETLALRSCHATTLAILNLREVPAGRVIDYVPWKARLTVLARKADWVQVDNNGVAGWISADYVTLDGDCG